MSASASAPRAARMTRTAPATSPASLEIEGDAGLCRPTEPAAERLDDDREADRTRRVDDIADVPVDDARDRAATRRRTR